MTWFDDVNVYVEKSPGQSVIQMEELPEEILEEYPDEKKGDNPVSEFISEVSGKVAQELGSRLEDVESGSLVGRVEYDRYGSWKFVRDL